MGVFHKWGSDIKNDQRTGEKPVLYLGMFIQSSPIFVKEPFLVTGKQSAGQLRPEGPWQGSKALWPIAEQQSFFEVVKTQLKAFLEIAAHNMVK